MYDGSILIKEFFSIIGVGRGFEPGANLNWMSRTGDGGVRASLSWDGEEGVISGDVVEWGPEDTRTIVKFDAQIDRTDPNFLRVVGEEDLGESSSGAPDALLRAFARQVSMLNLVT